MWLTRVVTVATVLGTTGAIGHWTSTVRGQAPACLVSVAQGALVGVDRGASCEFRGVPFAAPPLDALRWARPVAAGPWGPGVLQATANPPVCPQINRFGQPAGIEDCLKLNVWAPHSSNGRPLPVETGTFSRVPVIIGSNRDEGWTWVNRSFPSALFTQEHYESAVETEFGADAPAILAAYPSLEYGSPKNALSFLVNDAEYACGAERLSRLIERTNTAVYLYQFEYAPEGVVPDRAPHGLDVSFLFGTDVGFPILPLSTYVLNATDLKLFRSMARYWRQFAETGDPNNDDVNVHWPAFSPSDEDGRNGDRYLILDRPVRPGKHLREPHCAFWEPYFFRSITAAGPANTP